MAKSPKSFTIFTSTSCASSLMKKEKPMPITANRISMFSILFLKLCLNIYSATASIRFMKTSLPALLFFLFQGFYKIIFKVPVFLFD